LKHMFRDTVVDHQERNHLIVTPFVMLSYTRKCPTQPATHHITFHQGTSQFPTPLHPCCMEKTIHRRPPQQDTPPPKSKTTTILKTLSVAITMRAKAMQTAPGEGKKASSTSQLARTLFPASVAMQTHTLAPARGD
jgi:hypothetical protein